MGSKSISGGLAGETDSIQSAMLDSLIAEVALVDSDGTIVEANEPWRTLRRAKGLLQPALGAGSNYLSACDRVSGEHARDAARIANAIRDVLAGRVGTSVVEYPWHSKTGERWFRMVVAPLKRVGGVGAVIMHLEITGEKLDEERKRLVEQQFAQAQKLELIGRLAGGIAHDFNNVLTVINGYAQWALSGLETNDPLEKILNEIAKAGERATALTRQLVAFGGKQIFNPQPLKLNEVLGELLPMAESLVGEDVKVTTALCSQDPTVYADRRHLEQMIVNLVCNSRDAMAENGGELRIETLLVEDAAAVPEPLEPPCVAFTVTDTGAGMDEDTLKHIFEPLFSTRPGGLANGLGLSMVHGIVAQSGGQIRVESKLGHGATVRIFLPSQQAIAAKPDEVIDQSDLHGGETILVVEDLAAVRRYVASVLKGYGYRIFEAANGEEAIELCRREPGDIHLALTDVMMPNLSGWEFSRQLAEVRPETKVVLMSGNVNNAMNGALDERIEFIEKPFSPEQLARKVRTVLGTRRKVKVLVVDDEEAVRGYLRAVLEQDGYEVVEACDGREVVRLVREEKIDAVVIDLFMPGQEGLETIQMLHRDLPEVGVVAVSGAFGGRFLKVAHLFGADAVLNKPVSAAVLLASVADALKKRGEARH